MPHALPVKGATITAESQGVGVARAPFLPSVSSSQSSANALVSVFHSTEVIESHGQRGFKRLRNEHPLALRRRLRNKHPLILNWIHAYPTIRPDSQKYLVFRITNGVRRCSLHALVTHPPQITSASTCVPVDDILPGEVPAPPRPHVWLVSRTMSFQKGFFTVAQVHTILVFPGRQEGPVVSAPGVAHLDQARRAAGFSPRRGR